MLTFLLTGYFFVETYNAELTTSLTRSAIVEKLCIDHMNDSTIFLQFLLYSIIYLIVFTLKEKKIY